MKTSSLFAADDAAIAQLIADHPFGLLVSHGDGGLNATPLPLLLEHDANGERYLLGHFARANPQVAQLQASPQALAVFQGPHGYISPSWFADRTQAPTWNFATVHIQVEVAFMPEESASRLAVERLSAAMEAGRPKAWSPQDMGARYQKLLPAIIAFRARILDCQAKFKLGQNERQAELEASLTGLAADGNATLLAMMRLANAQRLPDNIEAAEGAA